MKQWRNRREVLLILGVLLVAVSTVWGNAQAKLDVSDAGKEYPTYRSGQVIVKLRHNINETAHCQDVFCRLRQRHGLLDMENTNEVALPASSARLRVLRSDRDPITVSKALRLDPDVAFAQPNYTYRICRTPNDPEFPDQYAHQVIQMVDAWDISTGSRDIVVAVLDTGVDVNHPDLHENIWVNPGEIPDNDIDDDENGYIDDIHGWNFDGDNNRVSPEYH